MDQVVGQALSTYRKLTRENLGSDQTSNVDNQAARVLQRA
jgi:hypothetical protein